jgi:hypothetical protein
VAEALGEGSVFPCLQASLPFNSWILLELPLLLASTVCHVVLISTYQAVRRENIP